MNTRALFRRIMLAAGFLASLSILLSASFCDLAVAKKFDGEDKTEQHDPSFVSAPSEAIPGSAVQVEDPSPSCFEVLLDREERKTKPEFHAEELARYFKVLFRAIISPNAP